MTPYTLKASEFEWDDRGHGTLIQVDRELYEKVLMPPEAKHTPPIDVISDTTGRILRFQYEGVDIAPPNQDGEESPDRFQVFGAVSVIPSERRFKLRILWPRDTPSCTTTSYR